MTAERTQHRTYLQELDKLIKFMTC